MSFFQKDIETMPRAELEKLQLEKLKHITKYCYDNVPLYKRKFDEAGFDCTKIKALSDIQYIPYTTKSDFRDNYPFGMFATPLKKRNTSARFVGYNRQAHRCRLHKERP